jgi:hypothetical protein
MGIGDLPSLNEEMIAFVGWRIAADAIFRCNGTGRRVYWTSVM